MAILRSRALSAEVHTIANPVVDRQRREAEDARAAELAAVQQSVASEVRAAVMAECAERIRLAEARAVQAEADATARIAAAQAAVQGDIALTLRALVDGQQRLADLERQLVAEAEADVIRLGMRVAAQILRREIDDDPQWLEPVLREALALVPDKRGVALRLHPDDAGVARERKAAVLADVPGLERLEIFEDPALSRGACILASQGTRLDASVSTTWERLFRELLATAPAPPLSTN